MLFGIVTSSASPKNALISIDARFTRRFAEILK
jgi:hypothetical protein